MAEGWWFMAAIKIIIASSKWWSKATKVHLSMCSQTDYKPEDRFSALKKICLY